MKQIVKIMVFSLLLASIGCATGTMQTARTSGEQNFQFSVEPGVVGVGSAIGFGVLPTFNIAGRYGVSDTIDLGARIGSMGYELQSKFMLTDPNDMESTAISIAPSLTATGGGSGGGGALMSRYIARTVITGSSGGGGALIQSTIPVIIGLPMGESELVIAPRVTPIILFSSGGSGLGLLGGASVGYAAKMGGFTLLPEIAIDVPFLAASASSGGSGPIVGFNALVFNIGVGLLFGGRKSNNILPGMNQNSNTTAIP